jgi:hypothetical protein
MTEIDAPIPAETAHKTPGSSSSVKLGIGVAAAVLVAVAAGLFVSLLVIRDDSSSTSTKNRTNSSAASEEDLRQLATDLNHPIYWAGPSHTNTYELTQTRNGSVYIRYLPEGVDLGDPRPRYTTVGTYPSATAYATLEEGAKRRDATVYRFESGALAVTYSSEPSSVFFAFPDSPYTVEVFDPSPARALTLVRSGKITTVGG